MEKVVKCINGKCGLFFGHSEKKTKCPFCKTEYGKVAAYGEPRSEEREEKKEVAKTPKKSFKIWKDN